MIITENRFIIDTMQWSFSRLNNFYTCPYEFYLHYIQCNPSVGGFFGAYGSFMHKILEMYERGELSIFEISQYYEDNFNEVVPWDAPPNNYVDIRQSYYDKGLEYLDNLDLILDEYEILGIEKQVNFKLQSYDVIGYIDLLLKKRDSGEIIILDHKSASLKFKKNGEISKKDAQHFLDFKRQLYLYSVPVIQECGKVDKLVWNMFKDRKYIEIPWKQEEYEESKKWVIDTIHMIENEEDWEAKPDYYYCHYLCGQREICDRRGGEVE